MYCVDLFLQVELNEVGSCNGKIFTDGICCCLETVPISLSTVVCLAKGRFFGNIQAFDTEITCV